MRRRPHPSQKRDFRVQLITFVVGITLSLGLALTFWPKNIRQLPWDRDLSTIIAAVDFLVVIALLLVLVYRQSSHLSKARSALTRQEQDNARGARHVAELRVLTKFASLSKREMTPTEALPQLLADIPGLVGAERSVLFLPCNNGQALERTAETGTSHNHVNSLLLGFEDALAQHVVDTAAPLLVPPATEPQILTFDAPRPLSPNASFVSIPVSTYDGRGAVVITSMGKKALAEDNMEFLELVLGTLTKTFDRSSKLIELEKVVQSLRTQHQKVCEERGRVVSAARAAASEKTLTELRSKLSHPVSGAVQLIPQLREHFADGPALQTVESFHEHLRELANILETHVPETRSAGVDSKMDIDGIVKGIVALQAERLREHNIDTRLELSTSGIGPGDNQGRLHQTFEEVLDQCIHRLQQIPSPRWLTIRSLRTAGIIRIAFWDNGKPLNMNELASLVSTRPGTQGKGVQVAASLVSELGGDFRAQNPPSGGLDQILEIPLARLERPKPMVTSPA